MGFGAKEIAKVYWQTLVRVRYSLITIGAMLVSQGGLTLVMFLRLRDFRMAG